ncbi:chromate transport protein ChrA [Thalassobacillus pellis]|nr:chromate transport protein ChrA [Thalassobacillus pellis]
MTNLIRPAIAVLLGMMAFQLFSTSYEASGLLQTGSLFVVSLIFLEKMKIHPALVYDALFLGNI